MSTPLRLMLFATGSMTDRVGAAVLRHLKNYFPGNVHAYGLGGRLMAAEGLESLADPETISRMGIAELLPRLPFFAKHMHKDDTLTVPSMSEYIQQLTRSITQAAADQELDAILCVESHFFSSQFLAGYKTAAKSYKVKPPPRIQLMGPAAGDFRTRKKALKLWKDMHQADYLLTCQPHEAELLRALAMSATYVGHPVLEDLVASGASVQADGTLDLGLQLQQAADDFRTQLGLPSHPAPDAPLVWLAPGEHERDVTKCMPLFDAVMRQLLSTRPGVQCVVAVPQFWASSAREALRNYCCPAHLVPLEAGPWPALLAADAALTCSGTATTMAAAAAHTPLVAATPAHPFTDALAYQMSPSKQAATPNLAMGTGAIPEVVAWRDSSAPALAEALSHLLTDPAARHAQVQSLKRYQAALLPALPLPGHPPLMATEAAALALLDVVDRHRAAAARGGV